MLQELDLIEKVKSSKEEFLSTYRPVRAQVEEFLRKGKKVTPEGLDQKAFHLLKSFFVDKTHREFPYYERKIQIPQGMERSLVMSVKTEGFLYPYSNKIETSFIMITVVRESEDANNNGPVAVLPPLSAFNQNKIPYESYVDIPRRVSEVLPLLTRS